MLLFCPNSSVIKPSTRLWVFEFLCRFILCLRSNEAQRNCIFSLALSSCKHFRVTWLNSGLLDAGQSWGTRTKRQVEIGAFFFLKEHQCRQKEQRMSNLVARLSDWHPLYKFPPTQSVIVTRQYTRGARTNKHGSGHLLHRMYSTTTAERIDTP